MVHTKLPKNSIEQLYLLNLIIHISYHYGSSSEIEKVTASYGGIYAVPWSFLIGVNGEIIKVYPGAILKSYDPLMFEDLIYNIESQLKINH